MRCRDRTQIHANDTADGLLPVELLGGGGCERSDGSSQVVLLGGNVNDPGEMVLFLTIDFAVRARNINGYIALFMDFPSLSAIKSLIGDYIDGFEDKE